MSTHPLALPSGTKLQNGLYTTGPLLGQGGFGLTYKGGDLHLRRLIAVKEFFPTGCTRGPDNQVVPGGSHAADYDAAKARFLQEARTLARFNHPGIVKVYSVFEENNSAYLVMEFLEGKTLQQQLDESGALAESAALPIFAQIAAAVEIVHVSGVVHRDIKPDNIFLTAQNRTVLLDFGTARAIAGAEPQTALLTPGYSPPEQYDAAISAGPAADIYALGATLYHTLVGQMPAAALERVAGAALLPPANLNASISPGVSGAIMKALELQPAARPQTVRDWVSALRQGLPTTSSAPITAPPVQQSAPAASAPRPPAPLHRTPAAPRGGTPTQVAAPLSTPHGAASPGVPPLRAPAASPSTAYAPPPLAQPPAPAGGLWFRPHSEGQILTNADAGRALEALAGAMMACKVRNISTDIVAKTVTGNTGVAKGIGGLQLTGQVVPGQYGNVVSVRSPVAAGVFGDDGTKARAQSGAILRETERILQANPQARVAMPAPVPPIPAPGAGPAGYQPKYQARQAYVQGGRGGGILTMAILGLLCCGILAPIAWVQANEALTAYGDQDPGDRGTVEAGRNLAIVGTILWILGIILSAAVQSL